MKYEEDMKLRAFFKARRDGKIDVSSRNIIPNDTKLFAQVDSVESIEYYLSSDRESLKIYDSLKLEVVPKFQFIDLNTPYHEIFGVLDL